MHTTGVPEAGCNTAFEKAWAALKERYGSEGSTVMLLIRKIKSFKNILSAEDYDSVGDLKNLCEGIDNMLTLSSDSEVLGGTNGNCFICSIANICSSHLFIVNGVYYFPPLSSLQNIINKLLFMRPSD